MLDRVYSVAMKTSSVCLTIFAGLLSSVAYAQQPVQIPDDEATAHLISHADAVYPPIAKVAHVQGNVVLRVTVDGSGKVQHIVSLSGNAMLMGAALDAVKDWKWRPFEEARGQPAVFKVSVPFGSELTEDQEKSKLDLEVGKEYFQLDSACRDALRVPGDGAVAPCRREVAAAIRFPWQEQRHLEILDAHQNLGRALLSAGKAKEAVEEFDLAIQIAEQSMKKSDAEYAYPYFWRAMAEIQTGMVEPALKDYIVGEDSMRLAIKTLPDMKKAYSFTLERMLRQHASVLTQVGRAGDAKPLLAEADSLKLD
jgi:TonB family protein